MARRLEKTRGPGPRIISNGGPQRVISWMSVYRDVEDEGSWQHARDSEDGPERVRRVGKGRRRSR